MPKRTNNDHNGASREKWMRDKKKGRRKQVYDPITKTYTKVSTEPGTGGPSSAHDAFMAATDVGPLGQ